MKLAYFVHDLNDAAVHRRVRMLRGGFSEIALLGFRRSAAPPASVEGIACVDLGRTADARMARRAASVARAAASLHRWRHAVDGAAVVLARQLETLALASLARRLFAPGAPLVFESLDVHRLMVSRGAAGAALRAVEGRLLRACGMLVVSSPAFVAEHFAKAHKALPPVYLVENKLLSSEPAAEPAAGRDPAARSPSGRPWRIGWFGVLRCRRSLHHLAELVRRFPGGVEVVLRGRPSRTAIPDFDAVLADTPGLVFQGAYDRRTDLAAMYGSVHFTWAIDFFEAGANSDWLLPNRLYEGGLHGAVPIALGSVETGRWLERRGAGLLLDEPLARSLPALFEGMDAGRYARAREAVARLPRSEFVHGEAESADFAAALAGLARGQAREA